MPVRRKYTSASLVEVERDQGRAPSLLDGLFTATQQRLLGFLFGQADRVYQVGELREITGAGAGAIHRELARLHGAGLICLSTDGFRVYVQANHEAAIHAELAALVRKSAGLVEPMREAFALVVPHVQLLFVLDDAPGGVPADRNRALQVVLIADPRQAVPATAIELALELAEQRFACAFNWPICIDAVQLRENGELVRWLLGRRRTWVRGEESELARLSR